MSKGFTKVSHSSNGDVSYYLREGECVAFKHSMGLDREAILAIVGVGINVAVNVEHLA